MKLLSLTGFSRREKIDFVVGYLIAMAFCLLMMLVAVVGSVRV